MKAGIKVEKVMAWAKRHAKRYYSAVKPYPIRWFRTKKEMDDYVKKYLSPKHKDVGGK